MPANGGQLKLPPVCCGEYDASKTRCRSCKTKSMAQLDPLEKAADCERAIRLTFDPVHREMLSNIREFWIALAQGRRYLSEDDLAAEMLHEMLDFRHGDLAGRYCSAGARRTFRGTYPGPQELPACCDPDAH